MHAIISISFNKVQWVRIIPQNQTWSYSYYAAPVITTLSPTFGPVKSPNGETVEITGRGFYCFDPDCKDLYARWGPRDNPIMVKAEKIADDKVRCAVPRYTKPDVLEVELTFNG